MAVFYTQNAGLALFYTDYRLPSLGTTEQGS